MSHYTRIKTQLRDTRIIRSALKELQRESLISDFRETGEKDQPTFLVKEVQGGEYRLEFDSKSEVYELGARDLTPVLIKDLIESRYAKILVVEKLRAQGYLAQVQQLADGRIKIRARKVA
jgi:hypothetical protein